MSYILRADSIFGERTDSPEIDTFADARAFLVELADRVTRSTSVTAEIKGLDRCHIRKQGLLVMWVRIIEAQERPVNTPLA